MWVVGIQLFEPPAASQRMYYKEARLRSKAKTQTQALGYGMQMSHKVPNTASRVPLVFSPWITNTEENMQAGLLRKHLLFLTGWKRKHDVCVKCQIGSRQNSFFVFRIQAWNSQEILVFGMCNFGLWHKELIYYFFFHVLGAVTISYHVLSKLQIFTNPTHGKWYLNEI